MNPAFFNIPVATFTVARRTPSMWDRNSCVRGKLSWLGHGHASSRASGRNVLPCCGAGCRRLHGESASSVYTDAGAWPFPTAAGCSLLLGSDRQEPERRRQVSGLCLGPSLPAFQGVPPLRRRLPTPQWPIPFAPHRWNSPTVTPYTSMENRRHQRVHPGDKGVCGTSAQPTLAPAINAS